MRKIFRFLAILVTLIPVMCSNEPKISMEQYGDVITLKESTPIAKILGNPKDFVNKEVKIAGKVVDVCKSSGCWVSIDDGSGKTIIAKSLEHTVAVPRDCKNLRIEVQGKVTFLNQQEEHEKHSEESDKHTSEKGEHVCPQPEVIVTMDAVKLEKKQ